jgi:uncharacterized membrane protein
VVARRNDSLGARQRWLVFAALASLNVVPAMAFAVAGAWPVLLYSVLEISALGGAFYWMGRRAGNWERLTVAGDRVVVERETCGKRERREFNRYWLRVEVAPGGFGRTPRVSLHSAGVSCGFGDELPVAERLRVAKELRRLSAQR